MITVKLAHQFSNDSKIGAIPAKMRTAIFGIALRHAARLYDKCDSEADYATMRERLRGDDAIGSWLNCILALRPRTVFTVAVSALALLGFIFTLLSGQIAPDLTRIDLALIPTAALVLMVFSVGELIRDRSNFQAISKMFNTRVDKVESVGWVGRAPTELRKASLFSALDRLGEEDDRTEVNTAELVFNRIFGESRGGANMLQFMLAITLLQRNMVDRNGKILPFYRTHLLNKNDLED